ncbi:MAG: AbrB/MazE/SpoVT family DNA-binding domain-containing protein [Anaerolineales bacterium]|nr:AbrB/MazE/SpoVT family DNA-binding domain-containing protein [Anaerolineales bacterium]
MNIATISSNYQIVIPRQIREQLKLKPGQKVAFIRHRKSLRLVIVPPIEQAHGLLEGIDTDLERERLDVNRQGG